MDRKNFLNIIFKNNTETEHSSNILIKKYQTTIIILYIIATISLMFLGYYIYQKYAEKRFAARSQEWTSVYATSTPIANQDTNKDLFFSSPALNSLKDLFQNQGFKPNGYGLDWVSDDGFVIHIGKSVSEGVGLERINAHAELKDSNSTTSKIVKEISEYFEGHNYTKNNNNFTTDMFSTTIYEGNRNYDYIEGYENDIEKCLLTVDGDEIGNILQNITVQCVYSIFYEFSYNEQAPFLKALDNWAGPIYIDSGSTNAVKALGGSTFILFSKKHGYWENIYMGNDQPNCETLRKYDFPKELHNSCFQPGEGYIDW